jgi:hypothetical protein
VARRSIRLREKEQHGAASYENDRSKAERAGVIVSLPRVQGRK